MNTSVHWQSLHSLVSHPQKLEVQKELKPYWLFRDQITVIDWIAIKGRRKILPISLQDKAITQLHISHMDIDKTRVLACKSIYWMNININIEEAIKRFPTCLDYQVTCTKEKLMSNNIPGRPHESVKADIFTINNKHYLCIADYHSRFSNVKQVEGFSADNLMKHVRLSSQSMGCPVW